MLPLEQVKVGDKVATVGSYVEVVAWMHRDLDVMGDALEIVSTAGTMRVTQDHLIFVDAKNTVALPAWQVMVGSRIVAANGMANVTKVSKTQMHGHMLPLTTSGDLLVGGMLASCYGEVGTLSHRTINAVMAPIRSTAFPQWLRPQTDAAWKKYADFLKHLVHLFGVQWTTMCLY